MSFETENIPHESFADLLYELDADVDEEHLDRDLVQMAESEVHVITQFQKVENSRFAQTLDFSKLNIESSASVGEGCFLESCLGSVESESDDDHFHTSY